MNLSHVSWWTKKNLFGKDFLLLFVVYSREILRFWASQCKEWTLRWCNLIKRPFFNRSRKIFLHRRIVKMLKFETLSVRQKTTESESCNKIFLLKKKSRNLFFPKINLIMFRSEKKTAWKSKARRKKGQQQRYRWSEKKRIIKIP